MVRHGESKWNVENLFTGWYDADLSEKGTHSIKFVIITNERWMVNISDMYFAFQGIEEAKQAGVALKNLGFSFDLAHTSVLTRAQKTLNFILEELGQTDIPIYRTWCLNERHYGALTGLNKAETADKYGNDQVS